MCNNTHTTETRQVQFCCKAMVETTGLTPTSNIQSREKWCRSEQHKTSQTNDDPLKIQTQVNPQTPLSAITSLLTSLFLFCNLFQCFGLQKIKQSLFFWLCPSNHSGFSGLEFPHKHALLSSSISYESDLNRTEYMAQCSDCSASSPMNSGQVF